MARKRAVVKGVKGFAKHPVVAISPNGDAKHFDSVTAVQRFLKYPKKSQAVLKAIHRKYPVRGYKIMYEEDWSPLGDYSFRLPCDRDFDGHPTTALRRQLAIRAWQNKTDEERQKMTELIESGFVDSFRYKYPDARDEYSWWSYRMKARERNVGWRIDYFLVSEDIKDKIIDSKIHQEVFGSDHCPVELDIEL